jgi:hypothetical protein
MLAIITIELSFVSILHIDLFKGVLMNEVAKTVKTSALAIWSLVLGIVSLLCLGVVAGVPAIICGHIARSNIKQSQGNVAGSGLALAGLILGYVGAVITTLGIVIAITLPALIGHADKAICASVEAEAKKATNAVSCYVVSTMSENLPTLEELGPNTDCEYIPIENVGITFIGTSDQAKVIASDNKGKCPRGKEFVISIPEDPNDGWR